MYDTKTHSIENRIVNVHQPHVRPIKMGKNKSDTEFGAKIQASLMDGYVFIDELNREAFILYERESKLPKGARHRVAGKTIRKT